MPRQIYVNLPVKRLPESTAFLERLGFQRNAEWSNEQASCMVWSEHIYVMLLVETFFQTFTHKAVCDTQRHTEVLVCLSCDTRAEVDALVAQAVAAGGTAPRQPIDHGVMYSHGFEDLDGHTWELVAMTPAT